MEDEGDFRNSSAWKKGGNRKVRARFMNESQAVVIARVCAMHKRRQP